MEKLPIYDTREIRVEDDVYLQIDRIFSEPKPYKEIHRALGKHSVERVLAYLNQMKKDAIFYTGISATSLEFIELLENESSSILSKLVHFQDRSYLNIVLYFHVDEIRISYPYTFDYETTRALREVSDLRKYKNETGVDLEGFIDEFNTRPTTAARKIAILKELLMHTDFIGFNTRIKEQLTHPFLRSQMSWDEYVMSGSRLNSLQYTNKKPKFNVDAPTHKVEQNNDLLAIWELYIMQQKKIYHALFSTTHLLWLFKNHIKDPRNIKFVNPADKPKYCVVMYQNVLGVQYRDDDSKREVHQFIAAELGLAYEEIEKHFRFLSAINFTFLMLYLTGEIHVDIDYIPSSKNFAKPYKHLLVGL